mmetsp:Transcript_19215/g.57982  ORF Transcript_19215/g.57982 Transcript_19215/m.57982 type:complete len:244 (-) Transcript_19215:1368-2099(-)
MKHDSMYYHPMPATCKPDRSRCGRFGPPVQHSRHSHSGRRPSNSSGSGIGSSSCKGRTSGTSGSEVRCSPPQTMVLSMISSGMPALPTGSSSNSSISRGYNFSRSGCSRSIRKGSSTSSQSMPCGISSSCSCKVVRTGSSITNNTTMCSSSSSSRQTVFQPLQRSSHSIGLQAPQGVLHPGCNSWRRQTPSSDQPPRLTRRSPSRRHNWMPRIWRLTSRPATCCGSCTSSVCSDDRLPPTPAP